VAYPSSLWKLQGACLDGELEAMFVAGAAQHHAKRVCQTCPVRRTCGEYALKHRIEHGVWGGMTERERRAILRRRTVAA